MDWYSWLSKTNLEPTFVYEYGLALARNELQEDDITYFNHDFLQSIGIAIAKHRLEILKLARKEVRSRLNGFSRLVLAMNKTKKLFTKINIRIHKTTSSSHQLQQVSKKKAVTNGEHKAMIVTSRTVLRSGPLDRRMQEKLMGTTRSVSVSGPLDAKMLTYPNWSPMVMKPYYKETGSLGLICQSPNISAPVNRLGLSPKLNCYSSDDDGGVQSLWALMFQDMKPT